MVQSDSKTPTALSSGKEAPTARPGPENASARRKAIRSGGYLESLIRISEMALAREPMEEVFDRITREVSTVSGYKSVAVEIYDPERRVMVFVGSTGLPAKYQQAHLEVPVGDTPSGRVVETRKTLIAPDVFGDEDYRDKELRRIGTRTFISAPMITGEEVLGAISMGHPEKIKIKNELVNWLELMANHLAFLIQQRRATQLLEERGRLDALGRDVGLAIALEDEPCSLLQACAQALVNHLGVSFARIWTLNPGDDILRLQASAGRYTALDGSKSRMHVGENTKLGLIARSRQPHLTNAVIGDPLIVDQDWARREGYASFAGHPLTVGEKLVGVMGLFSREKMSGQVVRALESVANQIALGLDRLRTLAALRISEARTRSLLELMPYGVYECTVDGRIVASNSAYSKISGYSMEEMKTMRVWDFMVPGEQKDSVPGYLEYLAAEKPTPTPYLATNLNKDGRRIEIQVDWTYKTDGQGRVVGFVCVLTDITERVAAEKALRESEALFSKAFRANPNAISISRLEDGAYLEVNEGFSSMYGHTREEALGRSAVKLRIWGDDPGQEEVRRKILKSEGRIREMEFTFRRKDGRTGTALNSAEIIEVNGQPCLLSISQDITARKEAEGRIWAILETAPNPIVVYGPQGEVVYLNPAFTQVFGWELEELAGRKIPFVPQEEEEKSFDHIKHLFATGDQVRFDTKRRTKSGTILDVSINAAGIKDHREQVLGMVVNIIDLSVRKKMEAQLLQSQKMEAIGVLAGGIAHDFNNILQAISGYAQLLHRTGDLPGPDREHITKIDQAAQRGSDLVRQLLAFSRKTEPTLKVVDLNHEILQAAQVLQRTLPKMIRLETRLDPGLTMVKGDPTQLERVFLNLGSNARDAMPDGGRLTFETCHFGPGRVPVEGLGLSEKESHILIRVRDTGQGMDEQTRKHIFDPFFTTKEVGEGTGLGLASVYGIVRTHGGQIDCRSEPGRGTVFSIYLPASAGAREASLSQETLSEEAPGGRERIMIVEDEEPIMEIARIALGKAGYDLLSASSGEEALDLYSREGPSIDLVLLDMSMPGMGGLSALGRLLEMDPGVKVLVASGYSSEDRVNQTLEAGAKGFIGKPYRLVDLQTRVRSILDGEDC